MWYLSRYYHISISEGAVNVLKRDGLNRLPKNEQKRSLPAFKRYEKQVPGNRIQMDVKFLFFQDPACKMKKLFQYTAIDDATRAKALKVYSKYNQQIAIDFVDYIRGSFPFLIHTIQTDNGHQFQAKFH